MTKDTEEVSQFTDSVTFREYTLPRDENSSEPKGWIRGNTKIGPVLELTTCCVQGEYGVEIRIKSVNQDTSHSWVRIYHGLNKLVTNLNNKDQDDNGQETSEMQFEEYALKLNAGDFASRSKAKKLVNLLRHGSLLRDNDGAIEFWRLKNYLQDHLCFVISGLMKKWKSTMAKGGGNKKIFQYCIGPSGQEILYLRALQGHSGRNLIDPSLQDNVLIPNDVVEYIHHVGCAINLHSIMYSGLIPGGQKLSNRQTVFFCLWILWRKNIRILIRST